MRTSDILAEAFGNVRRQRLRSVLTIFAVVIGATSVTIMLAIASSAQTYFYNQLQSSGQLQQVQVSEQTSLDYQPGAIGGGPGNALGGTQLTDAMAATIKTYPHVVTLTRTAGVNAVDYVQYQGGQKLAVMGVDAYDPNGVIENTFLAGQDFSSGSDYDVSSNTGPIIITSDYADKMGFAGNYTQLIKKTVAITSVPGFSGEGATVNPPPPRPGCPNGCPNGGAPSLQNQSPTTLLGEVVGVISSDRGPHLFVPMTWAFGLAESRMYLPNPNTFAPCTPPPVQGFNGNPQPNNNCPQPVQSYHLVTFNSITGASTGFLPGEDQGQQQQRNQNQGYTSFIVKVDDPNNAEAVAAKIRGLGVGAVSAQQYLSQQENAFTLLSLVLGTIGGIALLVAAIGVINTMVMAILERTREIGVLRACGATRATIRRLFVLEAGFLGFMGGVVGVAVGYGLSKVANGIINKTAKLAGAQDIIVLPLWLIVGVVVATTAIGILAGLYPAIRAARLNPIDALRYE